MVVQHNLDSMNSNRMLSITTGIQAKSTEKLSSGYRINRAADDAAGLAISEKMRRQVRGLTQASSNAQDGISWCQIADGALDEVSNMISRAKELAVKAANDTLSDEDRSYINEEVQKLASEIDRTHASTTFNNIHVFADDGYSPQTAVSQTADNVLAFNLPNGKSVEITLNFVGDSSGPQSLAEPAKATGVDTAYGSSDFAGFVKKAASDAVYNLYQNFPTLFSKGATSGIQVGLELAPGGEGGVLASASLGISTTSSSTVMTYKMYVDTSDYPLSGFSEMSDDKKADLAATIAHEMTHIAMYDTLTDGMLSSFPKWFKEGVAQTSSGDGGWVRLTSSSSDGDVKNYMSKMNEEPYGAGYLAAMYLGYAVKAADGGASVDSSSIKQGLNKLMGYMAENKKSLNDAINDLTGYSGLSDFEGAFTSATAKSGVAGLDPLAFTKQLVAATGDGAGSLFGSLNATQSSLFAPSTLTSSGGNYTINSDNTAYSNAFGEGYNIPDKQSGLITGEGEIDGLGKVLYLQVGSETDSYDEIGVKRFNITTRSLTEGKTFDTSTREMALQTIETVNVAGLNVTAVRSYYGGLQNRLEHTIKNLDNVVENTQSAESLIRDTDMATETFRFTNNQILVQAGQALLSQANQSKQGVLTLLQ